MRRRDFFRAAIGCILLGAAVPEPKPEYAAFTIPFKGRIPDKMIVGDPVVIPLDPALWRDYEKYS